jgi:hypothetical protein
VIICFICYVTRCVYELYRQVLPLNQATIDDVDPSRTEVPHYPSVDIIDTPTVPPQSSIVQSPQSTSDNAFTYVHVLISVLVFVVVLFVLFLLIKKMKLRSMNSIITRTRSPTPALPEDAESVGDSDDTRSISPSGGVRRTDVRRSPHLIRRIQPVTISSKTSDAENARRDGARLRRVA